MNIYNKYFFKFSNNYIQLSEKKMLTTIPTDLIVCGELDDKLKIKREIYYDDKIQDENPEVKRDKWIDTYVPIVQKELQE